MLFAVKRNEFLAALKTAACAAKSHAVIPALSGVFIQADERSGTVLLSCTDGNTFLQRRIHDSRIKEGGHALFNLQILMKYVELANTDVVVAADEKSGVIYAGQAKMELQTIPVREFPVPQMELPDKTVKVSGLKALIRRSIFATANVDGKNAVLESVRFTFDANAGKATATDQSVCAVANLPQCADGELNIILHQDPLSILYGISNNDDSYFIGISKGKAVLFNENILFVTQLINGEFANVDMLVSNFQAAYQALVDAKKLYQAVDQCTITIQDNTNYSVNLAVEPDGIRVSMVTCYGTAKNFVPSAETIPTDIDGFHYNPDKILSFLRHSSGPLELQIDKHGCLLMKANNTAYFVGPRRPAEIQQKKDAKKNKSTSTKKKSKAEEQLKIAA